MGIGRLNLTPAQELLRQLIDKYGDREPQGFFSVTSLLPKPSYKYIPYKDKK